MSNAYARHWFATWSVAVCACAVIALALTLVGYPGPAVAALVVLTSAGSSVWMIRLRRRAGRSTEAPRTSAAARGGPAQLDASSFDQLRSVVRQLDVPGLCWAWRRSHQLLAETQGLEARTVVVMLRQEYLDEMERRDGSGFRRWLEADANATGDPEKYLNARAEGDGRAAA